MSKTTDFNFWIPAIIKSGEDKDGKRWIQGIASTSDLDLQGESILQNGLDYSYFLKHGYFNNDHLPGPDNKVGEPTEAKVTKDGFWVKGFLYKGKEQSDKWWEHLKAIDQSGANRRVGFSVQGKVIKRDGSKIEKCWIQECAITACPVNTNTWAEIAKSLCSSEWCQPSELNKSCNCPNCDGNCADHSEKAMSTSSAGMLVPQSLDGSAKVQTYKSLNDIPAGAELSHDEWVRTLQLSKGWSRATAEAVCDAIFVQKGLI